MNLAHYPLDLLLRVLRIIAVSLPLIPIYLLPPQSSCLERGLQLSDDLLLEHLQELQRTYTPLSGMPQVMVDMDSKEFFAV